MSREMVIQAEVGGATIAFTHSVYNPEQQNALIDESMKGIERVRAHQALVEALVDVDARHKRLAQLPQARKELAERRIRERKELQDGWVLEHDQRNQRADFKLKPQHLAALSDFDTKSNEQLAALDTEKERIEKELPLYEEQVERQKLILAGKTRAEVIVMPAKMAAE